MNRQKLFDSFIEFMGRFVQLKAVAALRDGFIMTTPFTICGSVFLLLANLPVPGYGDLACPPTIRLFKRKEAL